ncbi:MAG: DNA polymerase III subunit delta [Bacillota bacterium]
MQYFKDLLAELEKGKIKPLYLFHGPEVFLQREAVRRFGAALVGEEPSFNFEVLDGEEVSEAEVAEIAGTPPLFSNFRLVVVRNAPYFLSGRPKEHSSLVSYLRQPEEATCLIFCTAGSVDKRREVYKLVEARGRVVEFIHLAPEDLRKWFQKKARQVGKTFEASAVSALLSGGRDLTFLNNEVEKVLAYAGDRAAISAGDVAAVLNPSIEETVFAATDALGERRYPDALAKIKTLLEKEPQGVVLSLLARQLRLIILAQDILVSGKGREVSPRDLGGVHPFVAKKSAAQALRFPRTELEALFRSLLEVDMSTKTSREDFYEGLERRLLLLSLGKKSGGTAYRLGK